MKSRIIADLFLLISVFSLPWWMTVVFGAFFSLRESKYYEFMVAGFFMDVLYGNKIAALYDFGFVFLASTVILYIILYKLKILFRLYV